VLDVRVSYFSGIPCVFFTKFCPLRNLVRPQVSCGANLFYKKYLLTVLYFLESVLRSRRRVRHESYGIW
jgi:hypothetical protein